MTYGFFDYKYNIVDYHGEHYGSGYQTGYLIVTLVLSLVLAILLRKVKKENIKKAIGIIGIVMTVLYLVKTIWESHYDVMRDGFNTYLLPFDTCSILMWSALVVGFGRGLFQDCAKKWMVLFGFAGGMSNLIGLRAFNYYPFFTFGAFYSMLWHAVMIFLATWLLISEDVVLKPLDIVKAFGFHCLFSATPIAVNMCVSHMNWMLYDNGGGIPFVEDLCAPYADTWIAVLIVLATYLFTGALLAGVFAGIRRLVLLIKKLVVHHQ